MDVVGIVLVPVVTSASGAVSASAFDVACGGIPWITAIAYGDVWGRKAGMLSHSLENFEPRPQRPRSLSQMASAIDLIFSYADLLDPAFPILLL